MNEQTKQRLLNLTSTGASSDFQPLWRNNNWLLPRRNTKNSWMVCTDNELTLVSWGPHVVWRVNQFWSWLEIPYIIYTWTYFSKLSKVQFERCKTFAILIWPSVGSGDTYMVMKLLWLAVCLLMFGNCLLSASSSPMMRNTRFIEILTWVLQLEQASNPERNIFFDSKFVVSIRF